MTDDTASTGLTDAQVTEARARHGWNDLPRGERVTALQVLLRQFTSFLVLLLIAAAGIAYLLGEWIDTVAILMVVVLNAVLGFVQEWRAETALDALRAMLSPQALVIRNGQERMIPVREIVPGDIVRLDPGDTVPADLDLILARELRIDESVLTGESAPVAKTAPSPPHDEGGRAFMGTAVVAGRAEGRVTAIGAGTSMGRIAGLTGSVAQKTTNLERHLARLARQLGMAALALAALVVAAGVISGRPPGEMFMTGLSMAVALVPEGLPAVVTVTLALGAAAMVRRNALVRRLQAVETLGAASVICTDKTGTLTENKMTVTRLWLPGRALQVTGTGYDPAGHIAGGAGRLRAGDDPRLARLLDVAALCNTARIRREDADWTLIGEPTEGALLTLAMKGWSPAVDHRAIEMELPFSSERKRMSVLTHRDGAYRMLTKGAPEQVLDVCTALAAQDGDRPLNPEDRETILAAYHDLARQGLRIIALAERMQTDRTMTEEGLTFLGLAGMIDPPRPEVKGAISMASRAGIRVIVITGDSRVTARAIVGELGLHPGRIMSGDDVAAATDTELSEAVQQDILFARTRPADKMRIVQALQGHGQVVAMTGDGINDAPALKRADIGVSMGQRGTQVAKEASDLVLLDDNFATIVQAIREGRRQFENVQKFVRYLLSSNAGEVVAILVNILIGGPLIFFATQILWMNLVTDGITAVALGLEKSERDQMERPPRPAKAPILGWSGLALIAAFGAYTGTASLLIFYSALPMGEDVARTMAFTAMVVFEKLSVFAFRSLRQPGWRIGWLGNPLLLLALAVTLGAQVAAVYWPPLQTLLRTVPLGWDDWCVILLAALPLIIVPELVKTGMVLAQRGRAAGPGPAAP